jgi:uncharacterized cofD-like protein
MPKKKRLLNKIDHPIRGLFKDALYGPSTDKILRLLEKKHLRYLDLIPRESLQEKIVHLVLEGHGPWQEVGTVFDDLLAEIYRYSTEDLRVVVFGGGTGLSSVLGGDNALPSWPQSPFYGMKRIFSRISVAVCVTDDGGSSGSLLRHLRCIAPGDLRRAILSSITPRGLLALDPSPSFSHLESVAASLQRIFNYRFGKYPNPFYLKTPCALLSPSARKVLPRSTREYLSEIGTHFLKNPLLKEIPLEGQCLGNLLLMAAIYARMKPGVKKRNEKASKARVTPSHLEIQNGIRQFASQIGADPESVYPACTTQGELQVLYQHGVLSAGEGKSSARHSSFPVDRVWVHFVEKPRVGKKLLEKIRKADLILLAPGSLYTSIIPILQIPEISEAIRNNRDAMKILGVNFWAQRGETDISQRRPGKEYYVSDLIEAYHKNLPGGAEGLFETLIVADLRSIPGDILRNYAMEGKVPIYLDKEQVREMGFMPVEADVFSEPKLRSERVIQHDPEKFARVLKTLCYLEKQVKPTAAAVALPPSPFTPMVSLPRRGFLCEHWEKIRKRIARLECTHEYILHVFQEIVWNNREILPEHLQNINGIRMISRRRWRRSTEWDNILGYFDPHDGFLKIHEALLRGPENRLSEDLLIAMGESLLGNYCRKKKVREIQEKGSVLGKVFEIQLQSISKRMVFLNDAELREYLLLAQMIPNQEEPSRFSMLINDNEAFTPPGLLFGLLYAWYVNNRFGGIVDNEMSLLRWNISELMPKPSMERMRMQRRIEFFRRVVFRQKIPGLRDDRI